MEEQSELHDDENYQQHLNDEHHTYQNQNIRENYNDWTDYIEAQWNKGNMIEKEDRETNILVYYTEGSKK
ncbi:hypothetical protein [Bacillus sp. BP-3]|uniref:hypothetical protein n=1 Tax=Bacillus sp. BP-3 TaxID=3022773 RepID=UPI00232BDDA5|nr:hypothetical protein [Bacillus sp. BP-3]MDC2867305.1 hypothetical protein [Bacillus sp. BP-3]